MAGLQAKYTCLDAFMEVVVPVSSSINAQQRAHNKQHATAELVPLMGTHSVMLRANPYKLTHQQNEAAREPPANITGTASSTCCHGIAGTL